MSFKIIRGDGRAAKVSVNPSILPVADAKGPVSSHDRTTKIEKEAFEQGYQEGERIGKQMGEKMVETVVKKYDNSLAEIAKTHKTLSQQMEEQTVRLALEISRKVVQRELAMDPDLVSALITVALKRVQGHQSITLRVSHSDCDRVRAALTNVNPAVTVKDDSGLERGDFIIDTSQTHIDGRVSSQVNAIGHALFDE